MRKRFLSSAFLLLGLSALSAQTPSDSTIFDRLYRPNDLLEIALKCDWDTLLAMRRTDEEVDGKFIFQDATGKMTEWKINISVRGKFRRRVCTFPPLKFDFSKKELEAANLRPIDKLKLVTHCMENAGSEEFIFREYLLYQMYQLLNPYSFRTQLVRVTYLDDDLDAPRTVHYGILIEDDKDIANRMDLESIDTFNLTAGDFPMYQSEVHALFQYLIGNTDWDVKYGRNVQLFANRKAGNFCLIPYDFDFSGFVNAPYAIPNPDYRLKNLRQRVYLGEGPPSEQARQLILSKRKLFYRLIRQCPYLSNESKYDCMVYLSSGFREIKRNKITFPEF
ncbi:MAG: hypothetical protein H6563_12770 [Lewinellaceae bacterium]|nr:hypothetical protein [Lewinellaceae bacterium]